MQMCLFDCFYCGKLAPSGFKTGNAMVMTPDNVSTELVTGGRL